MAKEKAGLPKLEGGLWHPYRRKWATERKYLPLKRRGGRCAVGRPSLSAVRGTTGGSGHGAQLTNTELILPFATGAAATHGLLRASEAVQASPPLSVIVFGRRLSPHRHSVTVPQRRRHPCGTATKSATTVGGRRPWMTRRSSSNKGLER